MKITYVLAAVSALGFVVPAAAMDPASGGAPMRMAEIVKVEHEHQPVVRRHVVIREDVHRHRHHGTTVVIKKRGGTTVIHKGDEG